MSKNCEQRIMVNEKKKIVEQIYDNNSKIINDIDNNTDE